MRTIMVATDFSERSDRALRRATLLAQETGASLVLVHAIGDDLPEDVLATRRAEVTELLARQCATLAASDGVSGEPLVVAGATDASLAQAAADRDADVLVIGSHRRQMLRDIFVGTTAERLVRRAQCPVLMTNAMAAGSYGRVLLATDLSDASMEAMQVAIDLDISRDALRSFLYVYDAPALGLSLSHTLAGATSGDIRDAEHIEAARQLAEFTLGIGAASDERIVRHDEVTPAVEILAVRDEIAADLIVVGTRGRTGVARLLLGSVAEEVLKRATCDVLAVPTALDA